MNVIARTIIVTGLFLMSLFAIVMISGSILTILDPSDDSNLTANSTLLAASIVILIVCVLCMIAILRSENRYLDTDNDGVGGDGLPASNAQKVLIASQFRQLGEFYDPRTPLTRSQAREVIKDLAARISKKP